MSDSMDIRWHQRFENFAKALSRLTQAIKLAEERELTDLEKQGLIQAFEFTHELAWNTIKDFYRYQGESSIQGSRDATRLAVSRELIPDGGPWMEMIKSRNKTSHTYNEETAEEIAQLIIDSYYQEFLYLHTRLAKEL